MWKWIWIALIIALAVAAAYKLNDERPARVPAAKRYDGYIEWRGTVTAGGREIEIVGVQERPSLDDCKPETGDAVLRHACPSGLACKLKMHECKTTVADRYLNMLQQKPASVHYVHHRIDDPEGARNMVMLIWGLTEEEALFFCKDAAIRSSSDEGVTVSCI